MKHHFEIKKVTTDQTPQERRSFGLCNVKNTIYMFGGEQNQNHWGLQKQKDLLNDFWYMRGLLSQCVQTR